MIPGPFSQRALVLLSGDEESPLLAALAEEGLPAAACGSMGELLAEMERGAGLAVLAEDALDDAVLAEIGQRLAAQPAWSDFPFVVLTDRRSDAPVSPDREAALSRRLVNVVFLPFRAPTLSFSSLVRMAGRWRRRQYDARALIDEVRDRDERLRLAQGAGGVGTFVWDRAAGTVTGSAEFRRLWGLEREVVPIGELDAHVVRDGPPDAVPPDPLRYAEYRIRRPDTGEIRWVARRGEVVRDADGQPGIGCGVVFDITPLKEAQAGQAARAERFSAALASIGTEMGRRIATHPWERTLVGPMQRWPQTLRTAVGLCLTSSLPVCIYWGPDFTLLYNESWSVIPGRKHPWALGRRAEEVWSDIWDVVGPVFRRVFETGEAYHGDDEPLAMHRNGYTEEAFFSYAVSPIFGDDGTVAGLFNSGFETTYRVVAERRARTLRTFVDRLSRARTGVEVFAIANDTLGADTADLPFALFYEVDAEGRRATCLGQTAIGPERVGLPAAFEIGDDLAWPFHDVVRGLAPRLVEDIAGLVAEPLVLPPWPEPLRQAHIVPIVEPSIPPLLVGLMVAGISPRHVFGSSHADFHEAIASHLATALANARGFETERQRTERLARQVEERTRERDRIWNVSQDHLVVADTDGVWLTVNPAWERTLGWSADDLVGRTSRWIEHPDEIERTNGEVDRLRHGEVVERYEQRLRDRSGSYRWFSWTATPESGLLYCVARDVTDEKARAEQLAMAQEQLRQSQKMEAVGQLTGGIAHDFNNLLTGIVGSLDLMRARIAQGRTDRLDRYAEAAMSSAERAAALTHRLLAFARRQPLAPKVVDANELIAGMADLLQRTLGERIRLTIDPAPDGRRILCDPNQLETAILNLVINARDAMPDGGRLAIETATVAVAETGAEAVPGLLAGEYVRVSVTDTGTGMAPAIVERAFDPFFTTKPLGQGTGLGLSMIYGFAHQSDGHARILSEVGHGTTVELYLPVHRGAAAAEPAADTSARARSGSGETIVVVEDETVVRQIVVEVLTEFGYRVVEAEDGLAGLAVVRTPDQAIDLLLTDVGLPKLSGRALADAARAIRPDIRILFMTGYAEETFGATDFLQPGMDMITKPFSNEALATRVRRMLDGGE